MVPNICWVASNHTLFLTTSMALMFVNYAAVLTGLEAFIVRRETNRFHFCCNTERDTILNPPYSIFFVTNGGKFSDVSLFKPNSYNVNRLLRGQAVCYFGYRMDLRTDSEKSPFLHLSIVINPLKPNDPYRDRTAPLTSKRCILYI